MSLSFVNATTINSKNVVYNELKVKHLKIIHKSLVGDNPNPEIIINNFNNIISKLTNLTIENINDLTFVDYFLLLLELRSTSIGDTIFAELTDSTDTKVEININKIIETLKNIDNKKFLIPDQVNNFVVTYRLPTINECLYINQKENLDTVYSFFIDKVTCNNFEVDFKNQKLENRLKVLEQLPAKLTAAAFKKTYEIIQYFNQINLLSTIPFLKNKTLAFNFNINNIIFLFKLLFGDQLMSLYDNIFLLCKQTNFTPEYIENCTPGEYYLFLKKLEMLAPKQTTREMNIPTNDKFDPFYDLPPVASRSEFTP
jgi:hypothetical protein